MPAGMMNRAQLLEDLKEQFKNRKFAAGLMVSMIDLVADVRGRGNGFATFEGLLAIYPKSDVTAQGRAANTLILKTSDSLISLRPFYNEAERLFRAVHKRFDYPSCAPHATQAWSGYVHWLDAICALSAPDSAGLRSDIVAFVLEALPDQAFDPSSIRSEPPLFSRLLDEFDFTAPKGEKSGASYQGAVFGFVRADNPHLQVEIDKVRTGSRRLQRVGDIDAWDGRRLAVTAEVKNEEVGETHLRDLAQFINDVNLRSAIGLIVAQSFSEGVAEAFQESGLIPLNIDDLARIVALWDPAKQRIAVESMVYYASHVEKSSVLAERLEAFIESILNEATNA